MTEPNVAPDVEQVLGRFDMPVQQRDALRAALYEREDAIADMLRMAGVQFGLFPQIVAEVLAEVGFGTPISAEQRTLVRDQFTALMEQLRQQYEN